MEEKECEVCGGDFETYKADQKYCSRDCMSESFTKEKVEKTCPNCSTEFELYPSGDERGRKFCSTECANEYKRKNGASGEDHWLYNRETSTCEWCGDDFEHLPSKERRFCSYDCSSSWQSEFRDYPQGPDNPNWSGGTGRITQSDRWKNLRDKMVERDNGRCQECGFDENLHVHHIEPLSEGGDPYNPDNLITLCRTCHRGKHFN